jgi:hypothetical protein
MHKIQELGERIEATWAAMKDLDIDIHIAERGGDQDQIAKAKARRMAASKSWYDDRILFRELVRDHWAKIGVDSELVKSNS